MNRENEIVGLGLRLTTSLINARARLYEHHRAGYSIAWGQQCSICRHEHMGNIFEQIEEALKAWNDYFRQPPAPSWVCEFCYTTIQDGNLPSTWDLVWQSAVCPECQKLVALDGGYTVVKGGAYADGKKDPRA